jgi:hypothetical protein
MNATEAINKIAELLGLGFKSEKFMVTKLMDNLTTITNNSDMPFSIGDEVFIVGEDSVLKPAPSGSHTTREGLIITLGEDSVIMKIEDKPEPELSSTINEASTEIEDNKTEMMTKAKLTDGTEIETNESGDFKVGEKLFVITESGDKVSAPAGEHTTESGITITVDGDGTITGVKYPDKEGEGSLEDYKSEIKGLKEAMEKMISMMATFSQDLESYKKDYEEFKSSPAFEKPIARKTFGQENIADAKVKFLRDALRK